MPNRHVTYKDILNRVPAHLRQYVRHQDYSQYSAINHAVWRYVMKQNLDFLSRTAHPDYVEGLKATGIHVDYIPDIDEMNACLSDFGWGAVVVDGLIPSVAFFDFQAHKLLPVSVDIRTLEHIEYTPAPDIIHEAAGHAPILVNPKFREYVQVFAEIGSKAIATKEEHDVFDAVRQLTITLENPMSSAEEIQCAERLLEEKRLARTTRSEASLISRLYWWTVEYGLIGDVNQPVIYGAGLLSSVGESKNCLTETVEKLPFNLDACIGTSYDVTKPQPQLFVCEDFQQLIDAVQIYAERMAFRVGGTESVFKAQRSGKTATVVLSSGLQVSGTVSDVLTVDGDAVYLKTEGPTALAVDEQELPGHGVATHSHGFGYPVGTLQGVEKNLEDCSDDELDVLGISVGSHVALEFQSGVKVTGRVTELTRRNGKLVLITFEQCQVTHGESALFKPEWGTYDMAVGATIPSVFAGAANPESFFKDSRIPLDGTQADTSAASDAEGAGNAMELERLYGMVREIRESERQSRGLVDGARQRAGVVDAEVRTDVMAAVYAILETLEQQFPSDWLLRLELLELVSDSGEMRGVNRQLLQQLERNKVQHPSLSQPIDNGLRLLDSAVSVAG